MMLGPMAGDIDTAGNPDPIMGFDVIKKSLQRAEAAGTADQPTVQTDRQHLRQIFTLSVEHVESVFQILEEVVARIEALR